MSRQLIFIAGLPAAFLALASCASAPASTGVQSADINLSMLGKGDWSVACEGQSKRGRSIQSDADGRGAGDSGTIFVADVASATCTYAAGDAPFRIRLKDEGFSCPYGDYQGGVCDLNVAAGASGSFNLPAR